MTRWIQSKSQVLSEVWDGREPQLNTHLPRPVEWYSPDTGAHVALMTNGQWLRVLNKVHGSEISDVTETVLGDAARLPVPTTLLSVSKQFQAAKALVDSALGSAGPSQDLSAAAHRPEQGGAPVTLIRLSDIEHDRQVLVNLDQIVQVDARQGPRGLQQKALSLSVVLSDGSRLACFPVDEYGGFDSTTNDESAAIRNFQLAAQHLRANPEAEQGVSS